ncbi:glycine cleavage system T protein [Myriangium duriaei CBS 260.36]|uniref:Aminomethyltransferase n=1 Tax=Myriangium duriaei CBS 260.36 TaxID=1168546 RepID=A0A9P4MK76_9PEZI|nr:glycine cleavage system T protein [Myriangium duriaei CBS 260.36]
MAARIVSKRAQLALGVSAVRQACSAQTSRTAFSRSASVAPIFAPAGARYFQSSSVRSADTELPTSKPLSRTGLYELHLKNGGKMVPFGGFEMPVQYNDLSVGESHKWTREKASLFDVSHMVQYHIEGPGATAFLESLTPSSLDTLPAHQSGLSALLHPKTGGIVDDTIITRLTSDKFYVVTNAGCREKDYAFLSSALESWKSANKPAVTINELKDQGLVALQGPLSADILQSVLADSTSLDLKSFFFGTSAYIHFALPSGPSEPCLASRGGYTGEDGFEISVPPSQTEAVTELLLSKAGPEKLRLAGLGARDSLRLEAGMCLYGHDLDDTTTPVEAGLSWIIGKSRRETGGFNGAETVLPQLTPASKGGKGVRRRRVGFIIDGAPAREGADIVDADGTKVGTITSGCPSPSLGKNIAMGYIKNGLHKAGTEVEVVVRGKTRKAVVSKMPFLPSKYWKGGASPA